MEAEVYVPTPQPQVTLKFERPSEAKDLLEELRTWTPSGGWSPLVQTLFYTLETAAGAKHDNS